LDAFPPSDPPKDTHQAKKDGASSGKSSVAQGNKEMTVEAQATMAKFVHNATQFKSKENLVTELLRTHPSVTNARVRAMRELDVIADKRRLAGGGVIWEVKAEHLKKLGLKKKDLKKPPKESSPPKTPDSGGKSKKEKDPNAPKRNMSAYIIHSNATRNDVKTANPNATFGELSQILSKNFKALSPEDRAAWDQKAAEDKERYQKEMAKYSKVAPPPEEASTASSSMPTEAPKDPVATPSSTKKKRKKTDVSAASAKMFASFLKKKPKTT